MAKVKLPVKAVIDESNFLKMSASTQALYFHLAARADADGSIKNPRAIQRAIRATEGDYLVLKAKKYIQDDEE